jgi:hypothetical protein
MFISFIRNGGEAARVFCILTDSKDNLIGIKNISELNILAESETLPRVDCGALD